MAKTSIAALITDILKRTGQKVGAEGDGSAERADVLRILNTQNREILTQHSLRFMLATGNLTVASSTCAVPSTIDPAKAMTLQRPSGDGEIVYKALDEWHRDGIDTYGNVTQTEPATYTIAGASFYFHPTGLNATVPYIAQALVTALTDASASSSQLPEGLEDTLLAVAAEAEYRRQLGQPGWQELKARADAVRESMYGSERTTKLVAKTDREQKERKIEKAQLSDEALP